MPYAYAAADMMRYLRDFRRFDAAMLFA